MTILTWKEYVAAFNCFPELKKWIRGKDGRDYQVVSVRTTDVVLKIFKK